ncbi:MAG: murein biosynthesis integral membrane protein MurJ [Caldilineaceae bacterium]|nr:murein biosynthesis integral membrane protein MurJ [Caldilineaceae bacterium]
MDKWPAMSRARHLVRSSALVLFLYVLEKITGLGKLFLMTRLFGTGAAADAFTAANQLPELFLYTLTGGAIAAAFIPVYSAYLTSRKTAQAEALGNTVFTLTVLVVGGICGLAALAAPWISRVLLVPDFSPEQQRLTAELMRIVLLSSVVVGVSSVLSSLLQAHQHFLAPALALSLIDLGQIFGLYVLAPRWGIHGVAWGSVIGAVLLLLTQLPALGHKGIRLRPALALRLSGSREMAHLIWPRMITLGVVQAVDLVFLRLASPLPAGSITAFFYAMLVMVAMPKSLLTGTVTAVFFPTLAEEYNGGRPGAMQATLFAGLRGVWLLVIPAGVGLLALGKPAVGFLFQRGAFDERSTSLVFGLMAIFSLRLVMDSTQDVLSMGFYARHNTRIVMWANLGWAGLNVLLSFLLVKPFGIGGLAWATTAASTVLALALYQLNRRMNGAGDEERGLFLALARTGLACGGMAAFIAGVGRLGWGVIPFLAVSIGGGCLVYGGLHTLLGGREIHAVWKHLVGE